MSIVAEQLSFRYPRGKRVLDGLNCAIQPGRLTAIVGPNGSGKSTLIRLLAGLRKPESGSINLNDQPIGKLSSAQRANRVAFIEQRPQLAFDFPVRRVIEFGQHRGDRQVEQIRRAIEIYDLKAIVDRPYGELSVGQQQRVSIARAWVQISMNDAGYLLADEPCSAMDPKYVNRTMNNLRQLTESGIGVGIVIHDLTSAARWADDAILLGSNGQLVGYGQARSLLVGSLLSDVFDVEIERFESEDGLPVLYAAKNNT